MSSSLRFALFSAAVLGSVVSAAGLDQPWQQPYAGEEATGESVVALWTFAAPEPGRDASGKGHDLTLRGRSRYVEEGGFGGILETFPTDPENMAKDAQGAVATRRPELSPEGPFTLEVRFQPKADFAELARHFLLDNKYYSYASDHPSANAGYMLYLQRTRDQRFQPVAFLGYGSDSEFYHGDPVELAAGEWVHLAFVYDGEGTGRFYVNGILRGTAVNPERKAVAPALYNLAVGDRHGSNYVGSSLLIDQVRILNRAAAFSSGQVIVDARFTGGRTTFVRFEPEMAATVQVANETGKPFADPVLTVEMAGRSQTFPVPQAETREPVEISFPLDTSLRPGEYILDIRLDCTVEGEKLTNRASRRFTVVPRDLAGSMPVIMWGGGDIQRLKRIGFTHTLYWMNQFSMDGYNGSEPVPPGSLAAMDYRERIDSNLALGMRAIGSVAPARTYTTNEKTFELLARVDSTGKPYGGKALCAAHPSLAAIMERVGRSVANNFNDLPAMDGFLIHTEIRDGTEICYHDYDRAAFRQHAGFDIPGTIVNKRQTHYSRIPGFPASRVIPDTFPELVFYRWFWQDGDGWNVCHSAVHRGLKSNARPEVFTFFDPAVRVPSVWGSGGEVDVINQWTYTYPDPIKMGQATDEMFAMAGGRPGQRVMKMTQLIWKRFETAPANAKFETKAQWEIDQPDVVYYTLAPDHLREAFWSKIARPVEGIMYHGVGSLFPTSGGSYHTTTDASEPVLAELLNEVIKPLGPALRRIPDRASDVFLLESFAAQVFGGPCPSGWGRGWVADCHLVLQWAGLQPRVVYDETVLRDKLAGCQVLVAPGCLVLTEPVVAEIRAFQARGGLLVADEMLPSALVPDLVIESYNRPKQADEAKRVLLERAKDLRQQLADLYTWPLDSSNPEVVVRGRRFGGTDYVFAINDHRTFGDYVGHHGLVMEKGLPAESRITVRRAASHVYDLTARREVPVEATADGIVFPVALGPGGGGIYLVSDRPLAEIRLAAEGKRSIRVAILDAAGQPLDAVVPVEVRLLDPQGRPSELDGYHAAVGGVLELAYDWAPNDLPGTWTLQATELASGKTVRTNLNW